MEVDYKDELERLTIFAVTCRIENTSEWMHALASRLNRAAEALGEKERFEFNGIGIALTPPQESQTK